MPKYSKRLEVKADYSKVCRSLMDVPFLEHIQSKENNDFSVSSYYQYSQSPIDGEVTVRGLYLYPTTIKIRADSRKQVNKIYSELEKKL